MAGGRPTDYRPEFCERAVQLGREGKSRNSIAVALDCVRSTLDNWEAAHPEFLDAMARAKQLELEWWENQAMLYMVECKDGRRLNTGVWSRSMAARFPNDYRDTSKLELSGRVDTNKSAEELEAEVIALRRKHGIPDPEA